MSSPPTLRRAVALVRTGAERPAWATIGSRPIYQFWHMLSPHFRDVLLPPQRRSDGGGFSWSWRDDGAGGPPSAAELADLRQRLKTAERTFTTATTEPPWQQDPDEAGGPGSLGSKVKAGAQAMVVQFTKASDASFAGYVCRTESGPMIHSWGASLPATPCFVDAIECEIGGTVLLGDESGAGLELVLENRAGATIAQTRTDASGLFLFRKIPGGDYRIRVEHRGDFPTTGFSVSIEQDSIYGLELRRGAAVATYSRVPSRAPFESQTPVEVFSNVPFPPGRRSRRPLVIGALVLTLLGGAGGAWFFFAGPTGDSARTTPAGPTWQAAGGVTAVAPAPEDAAGAVGAGAGSSGSSVSRRKGERLESGRIVPGKDDGRAARASVGEHRDEAGPEAVGGKDGLSALSARATDAGGMKTPVSGVDSAPPAEGGVAEGIDPTSAKEAPLSSSGLSGGTRRVAATKNNGPRKTATAGGIAAKDPAAGAATETTESVGPDEAATEGSGPGGKSGMIPARAITRGHPGRGAANGTGAPEASGGEGASPVGPAAESGGAGKIAGGPGQSARAGGQRGVGTGPAGRTAGGTAQAGGGDGAAPTGADAETAAAGGQVRSGPAAKAARIVAPAQPDGAPAEAPGLSAAEAGAANDVDGTQNAATSRAATPGRAPEKKSAKVAGRSAAGENPKTGPAPDAAAAEPVSTDAARRAKPAAKAPRATAKARGDDPDTTVGTGEVPVIVAPTRGEGVTSEDAVLPQRHRLALADGGLRLLRDAILPTQPTPVGRAEPIEGLRRRLRDEQEALIPAGFRPPVTSRGVVLEVPASALPAGGAPRWIVAAGTEPAGASVQGARAELAWVGPRAMEAGEWRLVRPDGSELAHVALESGGMVTVRAIPAARSFIWVGVEGVGSANALEWRTLEGSAVAEASRRADRWPGGQGARLELPLGSGRGPLPSVALVDPASGWAVTFDLGRR